jgi:hypothetical protein
VARQCQTDGAVYEIEMDHVAVSCKVFFPADAGERMFAGMNRKQVKQLKQQIHGGMEAALAPFWPSPKFNRPGA